MKTVPLSELIQKTGNSRQLLMYHLKSLQDEYPEAKLYFKKGRNNYVTEEGVRLLERKLSNDYQALKKNKKEKESEKENLKKKKEKEKSDEFFLLEELIRQISTQQKTFNQTLDRLHEDNLRKDQQIESLHQILSEQQRITENQQQLSLLDKKEILSLPNSNITSNQPTKISNLDKFKIYIKAIRNNIFKGKMD